MSSLLSVDSLCVTAAIQNLVLIHSVQAVVEGFHCDQSADASTADNSNVDTAEAAIKTSRLCSFKLTIAATLEAGKRDDTTEEDSDASNDAHGQRAFQSSLVGGVRIVNYA